MYRTEHTHRRLLDWLLVVALALAPLQGVVAALDHGCRNVQENMDRMPHGMQKCHHGQATQDDAGLPDCCKHVCDGSACGGGCQLVHASPFIFPPPLLLATGGNHSFEPSLLTTRIGRTSPPLYRPPRLPA